jgi:hypothetical protein
MIVPTSATRAVLTLALGNPLYSRLAANLARSFCFWHGDSDIQFWIATDSPSDLKGVPPEVSTIRLAPGELGQGFAPKLHLDRIAPADRTLFVDADCLCCGPLDSVFRRFDGRAVGVVGSRISDGEWFGDVRKLLLRFQLNSMPKFNGGVYYVERGTQAGAIYSQARELAKQYDELELVRLRGRPNDELVMALAMARHGLEALPDDGTILGDPQAYPAATEVNVLRGRSRLLNPAPPDPRHRAWNPIEVAEPLLVHFLGDFTSGWPYRAEEKKLALVFRRRWPSIVAELTVSATFSGYARAIEAGRNLARPIYHKFFGPRPVAISQRLYTGGSDLH